MNEQLLKLYYSILEEGHASDSRYAKQYSRMLELQEELKASLPRSLHSSFDAYSEAMMKLGALSSEDAFVSGYRTGARLMLTAFMDD